MAVPPTALLGLYAPTKDLVNRLARRSKPRISTEVHVLDQGTKTTVTVKATCGKDGATVRTVRAERFASAFDECADPRVERTSILRFLPGGLRKLVPGVESSWIAQFESGHLLQEAHTREDKLTKEVYGGDEEAIKLRAQEYRESRRPLSQAELDVRSPNFPNRPVAEWVRKNRGPARSSGFIRTFVLARRAPEQVTLRIVIELSDGRTTFVTKTFRAPAVLSGGERFKIAWKFAVESVEAPPKWCRKLAGYLG